MKTFQIKTSLASGLTHRLFKLDPQVVIDACPGMGAIKAIRANQGIVDKINLANSVFLEAVNETEKKNLEFFNQMKAEYSEKSVGMPPEESAKLGRDLTESFNKQRAIHQKASTAQPNDMISVTLSDEDYEKVLIPVFEKTAQLWDVENDGGGQKLFLEVANALTAVIEA